jgi:hypothetical protein
MNMKCIWYWKWKTEGEEYSKVNDKFQKALKEHPELLPKLSPGIHHGRGVGFRLVEGNYEQLLNLVAIWAPVEEWKLEVYFEGDELQKAYRKWHPEMF